MKRFYWEWESIREKRIGVRDRLTNTRVAECYDPDLATIITEGLEKHYAEKSATVA